MSANKNSPIDFTDRFGKHYQISPMDIFYVEADNIYSRIICQEQNIHISYPLSLMEEILPDYFLRIHRSFLINRYYITAFHRRTVIMANGFRLPVPEKKHQWLKQCLGESDSHSSDNR